MIEIIWNLRTSHLGTRGFYRTQSSPLKGIICDELTQLMFGIVSDWNASKNRLSPSSAFLLLPIF